MWLFKKEGVREFDYDLWGYMVSEHNIDPVTLDRMRYVTRNEAINGLLAITSIRIFLPNEAEAKGIKITGWETFDKHPDLILFEGYINQDNKASLIKRTKYLYTN